jgi:D-glycero-D-manno-heptose 1,7-bisphosphate phosphatase
MKHRALFLDRDGTLVHRKEYPRRPEELVLFDGIGPALYRLQMAGWKLVVITNQGGMAFGYFDEAMLVQMHNHLSDELARFGAQLDGIYSCPHHPRGTIPALTLPCFCRKPWPGMLFEAAKELDIDLAQSWMIGDMVSDVEAGNRAGCHTALVHTTDSRPFSEWPALPDLFAKDTVDVLMALLDEALL